MQKLVIVIAAAAVAVSGCSSSSKKDTASSTSPTSASPSASTLSKMQFITQANDACAKYDGQFKALATPASESDFAGMTTFFKGVIDLGDKFFPELNSIVDQTADKAELKAKWLDPSKAQFEKAKVQSQAVLDAIETKDAKKVQAALSAADSSSNDSKAITTYLTGYGLDKCAAFEGS